MSLQLQQKLRGLLLKVSRPLSLLISKIHSPYSRKLLHANHARSLLTWAQPGDIFLTRTRGELSNLFIPGKWTHGALFISKDLGVIEAALDGVRRTDIYDFVMTKDELILLRPIFCFEQDRRNAADWAVGQLGKKYDFSFSSSNNEFYCFELVSYAYINTMKNCPWQLRERLGEPTIIGDDFIKASKKFTSLIQY